MYDSNVDIEAIKSVVEAVPGCCMLLSVDTSTLTIVAVSEKMAGCLGITKEQIYGAHIITLLQQKQGLFNTEISHQLLTSFKEVQDLGSSHEITVPNYFYDGIGKRDYGGSWRVQNKPVLNGSGQTRFIIHTVESLVEDVRVETSHNLRDAEQAYNLFMQAPVAVCILVGETYNIALANSPILQIWRKDESIIGKDLLDALPEIEGTVFPDLLNNVRTTGKPYYANESHAYFVRNGKEELVYFNFVYHPYFQDNEVEPAGVLVIATEVTEQVLARKKVEESEQRYRNLIAEASVATAVYTGREMKILYANDAMIQLWGKDKNVIGKTVRQALPELEGQPFHELLDSVYTTGQTYLGRNDKAQLVIGGVLKTFYFNFSYNALRNANGEIYGILNMAIDVTSEVLAREQVKESEANLKLKIEERTVELANKNRLLERSNEELEQFAYIASHDLQEPLRKIRVFTDRLLKTEMSADDSARYLQKVSGAAERMSGLINNLLEYSRLSRLKIGFEKVDLNTIVHNVLTDYELLITQKNAVVDVDELPLIDAVPLQMNQLFFNLIGNALKFTRKFVAPHVTITSQKLTKEQKASLNGLEAEKDYVQIKVADNGIGFNQDYANKIFVIFQRLNDKSIYGGYGIGLALCKKVVSTHKGIIYAEGKPRSGATFTIILPYTH